MDIFHRVGHMIEWFNDIWIIRQDLFLMQDFLQLWDHIAYHISVMHAGVLYGKIWHVS